MWKTVRSVYPGLTHTPLDIDIHLRICCLRTMAKIAWISAKVKPTDSGCDRSVHDQTATLARWDEETKSSIHRPNVAHMSTVS